MRPRPDAAETPDIQRQVRERRPGFNEAAARCRGNLAGFKCGYFVIP